MYLYEKTALAPSLSLYKSIQSDISQPILIPPTQTAHFNSKFVLYLLLVVFTSPCVKGKTWNQPTERRTSHFPAALRI